MAKRRPSGDGMVRKREDGRWEGRIVVGHKSNGDSIFRYLSAGSQKELLAKLHRNIEEYRDVDLREESKMPLGEWLDRWLEEYAAPSVRPSTLEGYRGYVERNIKPRLGNKPVGKITVEDIRQLYRELQEHGRQEEHPQYGYKLAGSTVRRIHGVLHEALDAAAQENLIARNPTDGIILPRKKAAPKQVLNNAQLERFMTAIQEDKVWHDFFYTELTTGLRRGEICGLMWQDFDEAHGTLTVRRTIHAERGGRLTAGETKTGAGKRIITLPPSTAQLLSERRKRSYTEWIFPDPLRPERPTRPNAAYVRMKELLKKAGLPSIRAYLCHSRPGLWSGRQDPVGHPGAHPGVLHPGYLHPCDGRYAEASKRDRGRFYGKYHGEVRKWQERENEARALSACGRTAAGRAGW